MLTFYSTIFSGLPLGDILLLDLEVQASRGKGLPLERPFLLVETRFLRIHGTSNSEGANRFYKYVASADILS